MSKNIQNQHRKKTKEARLQIVAELYKKGYSIRKIAELAELRLGLQKNISTQTIHSDIQILLTEWRKNRLEDTELAVQLELERIDMAIAELWEAWEKSKTDHQLKFSKQKGKFSKASNSKDDKETDKESDSPINTTEVEKGFKQVIEHGDPRYISEIRFQLAERRKLLGLYAPDKAELTGKNGEPLNPTTKVINLNDYTDEEKKQLLLIARKVEK